ncbi:MAG: hypothetical protein AABX38_02465 [Candidatus Micrarchaeota archaeon]
MSIVSVNQAQQPKYRTCMDNPKSIFAGAKLSSPPWASGKPIAHDAFANKGLTDSLSASKPKRG